MKKDKDVILLDDSELTRPIYEAPPKEKVKKSKEQRDAVAS